MVSVEREFSFALRISVLAVRIAHLSDVHILDTRQRTRHARYRFATKLVTLGQRATSPLSRTTRLARALSIARAKGADHVVISGDLTEVGDMAEFEQFAEVLHESGLPREAITLVPGNHDAYTGVDGWEKAMRGPLAAFAAGSASSEAGKVVDRGPVAFLPIDTTCFQTIAWSGGIFTRQTADAIERRARDPGLRNKALVLVVHHPPFHPVKMMSWIDGLRGAAIVLDLLSRQPRLQLLHGHLHRIFNHIVGHGRHGGHEIKVKPAGQGGAQNGERARLFGAPAVCDGPDDAPRVRFYETSPGAEVVEAA